MTATRSLPIYGGPDEGSRPAARAEVEAALERGVDPMIVVEHVARGLDQIALDVLAALPAGEARPACAKGCAFCCHQRVEVTAPEVFLVARALHARGDDAAIARVKETARATLGKSGREYHLAQIRCALLEDGTCSIYAARPLACRRAHSTDASVCEAVHRDPTLEATIPSSASLRWNASSLVLGYFEGAALAGRPPHQHELHAALAIALDDPEAEASYLAGGDPLAPARTRAAEDLPAVLGSARP